MNAVGINEILYKDLEGIMDCGNGEKFENIVLRLLIKEAKKWLKADKKNTRKLLGQLIFPNMKDGARKLRFWLKEEDPRTDSLPVSYMFQMARVLNMDLSTLMNVAEYFYKQETASNEQQPVDLDLIS